MISRANYYAWLRAFVGLTFLREGVYYRTTQATSSEAVHRLEYTYTPRSSLPAFQRMNMIIRQALHDSIGTTITTKRS